MTAEEIFFFGVLVILLLRILFRKDPRIEGLVSSTCSGVDMYDYDGDGEARSYDSDDEYDSDDHTYSTTEYDSVDAPTECEEGEDGQWKWSDCSTKCGEGVQTYEFERNVGSMCALPKDCKLGEGNCVTKCTDYTHHNCALPS